MNWQMQSSKQLVKLRLRQWPGNIHPSNNQFFLPFQPACLLFTLLCRRAAADATEDMHRLSFRYQNSIEGLEQQIKQLLTANRELAAATYPKEPRLPGSAKTAAAEMISSATKPVEAQKERATPSEQQQMLASEDDMPELKKLVELRSSLF